MREKRYSPFVNKYLLMILAAVSVITLLVGICKTIDHISFNRTALETKAVITDAYVGYSSGDGAEKYCDAYMEYTVDGVTYNCFVENFDTTYDMSVSKRDYIGMKTTLLYDPKYPSDVRLITGNPGITLIAVGLIMAAGCVFLYFRNGYYERMIKNGAVLDAEIVDVECKITEEYDEFGCEKNYCSILVCEWVNPLTGQKYVFRSQRIKEFVEPYVGQTVRVYADPQNYEKYFVDVDDLLAKPFMNGKSKAFTYEKRQ